MPKKEREGSAKTLQRRVGIAFLHLKIWFSSYP